MEGWAAVSQLEEIRELKLPYVDKTELLIQLVKERSVFISRPRRFGKTLLVDTVQQLFLGREDLFEGLHIKSKWDWEKEKCPVVRLDFSSFRTEAFESGLVKKLVEVGKEYNLKIDESTYDFVVPSLYKQLKELNFRQGRGRQVVFLIDEYDACVISALNDEKLQAANLDILKKFFQILKGLQPRFILVTGSSRLAIKGVFSGANNMKDVSFSRKYGSICGFTRKEIEEQLKSYMGKISIEELVKWYNGYCFNNEDAVLNPYSVAECFAKQETGPHWVKTGLPELLGKHIRGASADGFKQRFLFDELTATEQELAEAPNLEDIYNQSDDIDCRYAFLTSLFYQAGYLSIDKTSLGHDELKLKIPNSEVKRYGFKILKHYGLFLEDYEAGKTKLAVGIRNKAVHEVYDALKAMLSSMSYKGKMLESHFHGLVGAFFKTADNYDVGSEVATSAGKADLFLRFKTWSLLIELKRWAPSRKVRGEIVMPTKKQLKDVVTKAMRQVEEKYIETLKPDCVLILVGNSTTRTFVSRSELEGCNYVKIHNTEIGITIS